MGEPFRARSIADDTLAKWFAQADLDHDGFLSPAEMQADAGRFFAILDTDHNGEIDPDELAHCEYEIAPEIQVMSPEKRPPGQRASRNEVAADDDSDRARKRRRENAYASLGLGGALQGAARYGLLNIPEPVAAADADLNRGVSLEEFRAAALARFQMLDRARQGRLSLADLQALRPPPPADTPPPKLDEKAQDTRVGTPLPPSF